MINFIKTNVLPFGIGTLLCLEGAFGAWMHNNVTGEICNKQAPLLVEIVPPSSGAEEAFAAHPEPKRPPSAPKTKALKKAPSH